MACGILVPQPGIKPVSSAVKVQSPNHGTTGEFPHLVLELRAHLSLKFTGWEGRDGEVKKAREVRGNVSNNMVSTGDWL